jgi:dimethylargininase
MSFRFSRAIVRRPSAAYHLGLTTGDPGRGDFDLFERQHRAYVDALSGAGIEVEVLEPLDACPDAHFVEDVAVLVPEAIVITRPGAAERRDESRHIEPALQAHGPLTYIEAPGTLDGGDVLIIGRQCFIGQSQRSNASGAVQLSRLLQPHGYACTIIPIEAGLHLKSSVNLIADDTIVVTRALANHEAFRDLRKVVVAAGEDDAANLLRANDHLLVPAGYNGTIEQIAEFGLGAQIVALDVGEARRMDGGLTCMSLRF